MSKKLFWTRSYDYSSLCPVIGEETGPKRNIISNDMWIPANEVSIPYCWTSYWAPLASKQSYSHWWYDWLFPIWLRRAGFHMIMWGRHASALKNCCCHQGFTKNRWDYNGKMFLRQPVNLAETTGSRPLSAKEWAEIDSWTRNFRRCFWASCHLTKRTSFSAGSFCSQS